MATFIQEDNGDLTPAPTGHTTVVRPKGYLKPLPEQAHSGIHGGHLDSKQFGNTIPAIEVAKQKITEIKRVTENAILVRNNKSPLDTEAAHCIRVKSAADSVARSSASLQRDALGAITGEITKLNSYIDDRIGLKAKNEFAAEIRSSLKAMTPAQREKAMAEAIAVNDTFTISAVLNAPSIIHGFSEQRLFALRTQIAFKLAPHEFAQVEYLQSAAGKVNALTPLLNDTYKKLSQGTDYFDKANAEAAELRAKTGF